MFSTADEKTEGSGLKPEADMSHSISVLPTFPGPSQWHILK
jgi:hypothetical protein